MTPRLFYGRPVVLIRRGYRLRHFQKGVTLIISLIVLVAMMLAGIALVRSIDTGNLVAGNLAFKQGATAAADAGTQAAINWLKTVIGSDATYKDKPDNGYYATSQDALDITGGMHDANLALVDWDFNGCGGVTQQVCIKPAPAIAVAGDNSVSYIIHRLCKTEGDPNKAENSCATYQASGSTSPVRGELKYGNDKRFEAPPAEYYRITSRVKGPKSTVSFVETIVHF